MIDDCCLYDHGSRQRPLTDAGRPEVHVLGARVQLRVALHRVVRHHLDTGFVTEQAYQLDQDNGKPIRQKIGLQSIFALT